MGDEHVVDLWEVQKDGSLAVRFERLLDLYAPLTEQVDGTTRREPGAGVISHEDFLRLLDTPMTSPSGGEDPK
jgi:hypothetical protein